MTPPLPRLRDARVGGKQSLDTYARKITSTLTAAGSEPRVHSHGNGRGEDDARRRGLARRRARRWTGTEFAPLLLP